MNAAGRLKESRPAIVQKAGRRLWHGFGPGPPAFGERLRMLATSHRSDGRFTRLESEVVAKRGLGCAHLDSV